jgi:hypothetical protein
MIYELVGTERHKARALFRELAAWQPFCHRLQDQG